MRRTRGIGEPKQLKRSALDAVASLVLKVEGQDNQDNDETPNVLLAVRAVNAYGEREVRDRCVSQSP